MKNKIAAGIMLLAGSIAAIVCLINGASLDVMLLSVFFSMLIFMIIGFAVQAVYEKIDKDAELRLQEEAQKKRAEEAAEKARKEAEEAEAREQELREKMLQTADDNINDILAAGISAKSNISKNN